MDLSKFPKVRNRKEARAFAKVLRKAGKTDKEIKDLITLSKSLAKMWDSESLPKYRNHLIEGEQVKLNVDKIWSRPEWYDKQEPYKQFVLDNEDRIFTVKFDDSYTINPGLIRFAEDDSPQQWLFSDVDLLVLDPSDGQFKETWLVKRTPTKD